jgi:hypothetical protein
MEITPEIVELVRFPSSSKALFAIDDLWMVEVKLDLQTDIDGEDRWRSQQRFFNYDGAWDEFNRLETEEMIFWEFGINSNLYWEYVAEYIDGDENTAKLEGNVIVRNMKPVHAYVRL